jgi:hypothetical protein
MVLTISVFTPIARADILAATDFSPGATNQTVHRTGYNIILEGYPRGFRITDFNGTMGVGIIAGFRNNEIDTAISAGDSAPEYIDVDYTVPQRVSEIVLVALGVDYYDERIPLPEEALLICLKEGLTQETRYTLTGFGSWNGRGTATQTAPGEWHLVDPFGNTNITSIEFRAGSSIFSDFALASIASAPVPEPASIMLFGISLLGAGAAACRHRTR